MINNKIAITEKLDGVRTNLDPKGIVYSEEAIGEELLEKIAKDKEQTVRNFLLAMQKLGYFKGVDVITTPLEQLIAPSNARRGFRITAITRNIGVHKAYYKVHTLAEFEVKEGETYITVNTIAPMSGSVTTYKMELVNGEYTITSSSCHIRS